MGSDLQVSRNCKKKLPELREFDCKIIFAQEMQFFVVSKQNVCLYPRISRSILLLNACIRVADVMKFTFVSLMPVHNVCRICKIIKE